METFRKGAFETNSSSSHSITFAEDSAPDQTDCVLNVTGEGDFGWEVERYDSPIDKINYALIAYHYICADEDECKSVFRDIKEAFARRGVTVDFNEDYDYQKPAIRFEKVWEDDDSLSAVTTGYIDHQSAPKESEACERLAKMFRDSPDELFDFVFGNSYIETDNDNR